MATLRVTLLEKYRLPRELQEPIRLQYGHNVAIPMSFGSSITPEATNSFNRREGLSAEPNVWFLDWENESLRSVLMPTEVVQHYFGDWRACDDPQQNDAGIPKLNIERDRVAMKWGNYDFATEFGPTATIKIAVPRVPKVIIESVNGNGVTVGDWKYDPIAFFKFESQLDPRHEVLHKAKYMQAQVTGSMTELLDQLASIPAERLEALLNAKKASSGKSQAATKV